MDWDVGATDKVPASALPLQARNRRFSRYARPTAHSGPFDLSPRLTLINSYSHFLTSSVSPIHCRHGCWRRTSTSCRRFYANCSIAALSTASSRPASSRATSRHCWRKRTSTRPTLSLIGPSLTCPSYPSCSNELSHSSWLNIWRRTVYYPNYNRRIVPTIRPRLGEGHLWPRSWVTS